jgi:cytochrome c oxidase cbb3-type subunit 3
MKFSTYLVHITGVSIYPLISLCLFVVFFFLMIYWMYSIDKKEIERIQNLPFDDHKKI